MAKTAWGRAYSAEFKRLQVIWKRTGKVAGKSYATWKTAFKALGAAARAVADKKGASPIGKRKGKRKAKRRAAKPRKKTRKKARKKTRKAARPRRPVAAKASRPRKARRPKARRAKPRRVKRRKAARRPKAAQSVAAPRPRRRRKVKRSVSAATAQRRADTTKAGLELGSLSKVETSFGDVRITKGGKLKRTGRAFVMTSGNITAPRAVIRRGRVAIKAVHRVVGKGRVVVESMRNRKLDLTVPGVLIIR